LYILHKILVEKNVKKK